MKIFKSLSKRDRETLLYAFEIGMGQYVIYDENKFIGVHLNGGLEHLNILHRDGKWSYGEVKEY